MSIDISKLIDGHESTGTHSAEWELRKRIWDEYDHDLIHNFHTPRKRMTWPKSIGQEN